jgi:peptidoglycan hydrolase-like protein with peptidoglycan-binding domain
MDANDRKLERNHRQATIDQAKPGVAAARLGSADTRGTMTPNRHRLAFMLVTAVAVIGWALPAIATVDAYPDEVERYRPGGSDFIPSAIEPGDSGPWVRELQLRLAEAGFRPGPRDGRFGRATLGAVYAFQKLHDLPRDGVFRISDWALLDTKPELAPAADPDRVEVDLERQVLYLVRDQRVEVVLPISSGNGEQFRNASGSLVRARTPEGGYHFYNHIDGWRISYLGGLYRPYYFRGGYAIHGSASVPPFEASHGCVRVELHDMDFLTTRLETGMPVFVYGKRIARQTLLPVPPRATDTGFEVGGEFLLT